MQHGCLIQTRELGHVLDLAELRGVHLLDVILVHSDLLSRVCQLHNALVAVLLLDGAGLEPQAL